MKLIKNNLIPALIILAAATLIIILALPLANTEWAEGFRTTGATGTETEPIAEGNTPPALLSLILPVFKVMIFMGVGGLLTTFVRRVSKRFTT